MSNIAANYSLVRTPWVSTPFPEITLAGAAQLGR